MCRVFLNVCIYVHELRWKHISFYSMSSKELIRFWKWPLQWYGTICCQWPGSNDGSGAQRRITIAPCPWCPEGPAYHSGLYSGQLRLYTLCFSLLTFGRLFSSSEAQVDEEVVFEAVRQNRVALRFAADELRWDGETHEPNIHSRVDSAWEVTRWFAPLTISLYPLHSFTFFKEERHTTHWCVLKNMTTILHQTGGRTSISLFVWCGIMAKLYSLHPKIFAAILIWSCNSANRQSCLFRERFFLSPRLAAEDSHSKQWNRGHRAIDLWCSESHVRAHICRHLSEDDFLALKFADPALLADKAFMWYGCSQVVIPRR